MLEKTLQAKVMKYLRGIEGLWCYKVADRYSSGVPDILGCYNGQFFGIELKVGNNKPTKLQSHTIEQINQCNGNAVVCYSLDEVKYFIEGMIKRW